MVRRAASISCLLALAVLLTAHGSWAQARVENPVYSLPYNDPKWSVFWTALSVVASLLLTHPGQHEPNWSPQGRGFVTARATWLRSINPDATQVWGAELGCGRYQRRWLSLGVDAAALGVNDLPIRKGALEGSVFARWHLIAERSASLFFESGVGLAYFGSPFPPGGTHLNFAPMYGLGSLIRVREGVDLHLEVRHQHFSNAGVLGGGNPGFDADGVSVGLQFRTE
jgi:Lipid A 3-O-deacylase (PagL)